VKSCDVTGQTAWPVRRSLEVERRESVLSECGRLAHICVSTALCCRVIRYAATFRRHGGCPSPLTRALIAFARTKKPAVLTGGLSKLASERLDLFDDRIGKAVSDGFLRGHVKIAVRVLLDLCKLLA